MPQIKFSNHKIILSVKKAPKVITVTLFFIACASVLIPLVGLILNVVMGNGLQIMFVFFVGITGFMGLYLFRMSLWNSKGKEIITYNDNQFTYTADYGWFKDTKLKFNCEIVTLTYLPFGHSEENTGILVIGDDVKHKKSVVKIPIVQLEKLIDDFSNR